MKYCSYYFENGKLCAKTFSYKWVISFYWKLNYYWFILQVNIWNRRDKFDLIETIINEISERITVKYNVFFSNLHYVFCYMACEMSEIEHKIDYIQSRLDSILMECIKSENQKVTPYLSYLSSLSRITWLTRKNITNLFMYRIIDLAYCCQEKIEFLKNCT